MFQPSPIASPKKRTTPKPAPKNTRSAKARTVPTSVAAESVPAYLPSQASAVGVFVRRSAARIAAEITEASVELGGFLLLCAGDGQTGLHEIRAAMMDLQSAIRIVARAAMNVKVRGEAGYTGD